MSDTPEIPSEFYFQWHITDVCNNRCKHCYHETYENTRQLDCSKLLKIADNIEDALSKWGFCGNLSVTGGEPFTRANDLYMILRHLDECDHIGSYDILTNGTLLGEKEIFTLQSLKKLRRIQVSLEGSTAELHDFVRGDGDFQKVISAIRLLKAHGFTVSVMTTLTNNNRNDLPKILDLLATLDVDYFALERFMPEGQGDHHHAWVVGKEELRDTFAYMTEQAFKIKKPHLLLYRTLYCLCSDNETVGAMCSAGVSALTILPAGTLLPCRRLPLPIGNIFTNGIIDTWYNSEVLWNLRNYSSYKGKCGSCEHILRCRGCRSMAYALTGDYLEEDPQCWK